MKWFAVVLTVLLAGCAAQPSRQPPVVNIATPSCSTKQQCDAMWAASQQAIETASGTRTRLVTDGRIVTYAPSNYGRMGGEVIRHQDGDRQEMRASFECYRSTDCTELRVIATNLFNSMVGRTRY
jgi:hypothetical protein